MGSAGFAKSRRLLSAKDYGPVFDQADIKVSCRTVLMLARFNQADHPRLGLVVSKKNARLAVQRNRIKRLVRESFRTQQQALPAVDIVFLARRGLADQDNAEIFGELDKLWKAMRKRAGKVSAR